jgi:hypothetical protein
MRKQFDLSGPQIEEMKMMHSQLVLASAGTVQVRSATASVGLGALVMVVMLSPVFIVCGYMLAQILGYAGS